MTRSKLSILVNLVRKSIGYLFPPKWFRVFDIEQGDIVIDVGANIGEFTTIAAEKAGNEGHILAIEPEPLSLKQLKQNTKHYSNIEIIEGAVMSSEGREHLYK